MILLTGGYGSIGAAIAKHLRAQRREVDAPPSHHLNLLDDAQVREYCAGKEYEALILAHGVYGDLAPMRKANASMWEQAFGVNVLGCVRVIRYAKVSGPIVLFGGGRGGKIPLPERASYAASKAALNAMVLTGAAEGLPLYGVAPGPQASKMNDTLFASNISAAVKDEQRAAIAESCGLEKVISVVDDILGGKCVPGRFYSARGL